MPNFSSYSKSVPSVQKIVEDVVCPDFDPQETFGPDAPPYDADDPFTFRLRAPRATIQAAVLDNAAKLGEFQFQAELLRICVVDENNDTYLDPERAMQMVLRTVEGQTLKPLFDEIYKLTGLDAMQRQAAKNRQEAKGEPTGDPS